MDMYECRICGVPEICVNVFESPCAVRQGKRVLTAVSSF